MKKTKDLNYYSKLPYKIELHYEPTDNTWIASHPELGKGSCYAIGETKEEALNLLEEEKIFLLEYAIQESKEIPEPQPEEVLPSGHYLVRLPRSLHKKLKTESDKENISLNQLTVSILSEYVGSKPYTDLLNRVESNLSKFLLSNWGRTGSQYLQPNSWSYANYTFPKVKTFELEEKSFYGFALIGDQNVKIPEGKKEHIKNHYSGRVQRLLSQD